MHAFCKITFLFLLLLGIVQPLSAQRFIDNNQIPEGGTKDFGALDPSKKKKAAEVITYNSRFKNVKLTEITGIKDSINLDTTTLNFQNMFFPERNSTLSGSYLYNMGAPFQSKIFTDQIEKTPFIFGKSYEYWITAPFEQIYYNTTTPYTNLNYFTTFGNDVSQEENFKFLFTVNLNKYLNIGFDHEILYSRGFYENNANRDKLTSIFGNYRHPRYDLYWKYGQNYIENKENGGISDDRYITEPLNMSGGMREYESLNIPVELTDAKNIYRNQHLFLHHEYKLGFERTFINVQKNDPIDSTKLDTTKVFVPVSGIFHTMMLEKSQKNYLSETTNGSFYNNIAYINPNETNDTSALVQVRNIVGLSIKEGFSKWAQMGLTGFLEHDYRNYTHYRNILQTFSDTSLVEHRKSLIWLGGELSRTQGELFNFSVFAKLCMLGEDIGDFEMKGYMDTKIPLFGKSVQLKLSGNINKSHPDYFLENYNSNHFKWRNDFKDQYRTGINGMLNLPFHRLKLNASVQNLTNYIYFNKQSLPDQYAGNIQVVSLRLQKGIRLGILHFDNDIIWQLSSNQKVLPLPDVTLYSDLYLKFMLSGVLTSHIGIDCKYHTSYYAPAYMPALSQFYNQDQIKIGQYPFVNIYGNFHLKRMRFFAIYSHASRLFASPYYFSAPHYPINPTILKVGISWNFYD
jgi:hypothetical protein